MAAVYPTSLKVFTTKVNKVDAVDASHVNDLQEEVVALQTYIGTNPHGDRTDLTERLNAMLNPSGYLINSAGVPQPTASGMIWYDTNADALKRIKSDNTIETIGGGLSNVIYQSTREKSNQTYGFIYGTDSLQPAANVTSYHYNYWTVSSDTNFVQVRDSIRFQKIAGINTLYAEFNAWSQDSQWVQISMGIGSATAVSATLDQTYPAVLGSCSLDVSGLDAGTMYDIVIKMRRETTNGAMGFAELAIIGQ